MPEAFWTSEDTSNVDSDIANMNDALSKLDEPDKLEIIIAECKARLQAQRNRHVS